MIEHAQHCIGMPCTCNALPQVGDRVILEGEVIARNTIAKWVTVKFGSGGLASINAEDLWRHR